MLRPRPDLLDLAYPEGGSPYACPMCLRPARREGAVCHQCTGAVEALKRERQERLLWTCPACGERVEDAARPGWHFVRLSGSGYRYVHPACYGDWDARYELAEWIESYGAAVVEFETWTDPGWGPAGEEEDEDEDEPWRGG